MEKPRRSHLTAAAAAFACIVVVLYGQALFTSKVLSQADLLLTFPPWQQYQPEGFSGPRNSLLSDQSFQVVPYLYYLKRAGSQGRVPLWNPHIMTGMPFLANMQSAVFYPLYWLVLLMPVPDALEWIAVAKILLGALGFYLFCLRALPVRPAAAFAGAVIYTLCGFNTVWLLYSATNVSMLAGWLLLAIHGVLSSGRARDGRTCFAGLQNGETLEITMDAKLYGQILKVAETVDEDTRLGKLHSFEEAFGED